MSRFVRAPASAILIVVAVLSLAGAMPAFAQSGRQRSRAPSSTARAVRFLARS